ncbi:hypothetical protein CNMCM7691_002694 [Aspergillus felis]|uniref:DUF1295 domain protein n=1 Tax=Aspergillus felis TaxID=1287682 RepID=A0A8H6V9J5_9EURO|nr:hypothetical protein CNMCM7691_002694 [Aspergillus felis]
MEGGAKPLVDVDRWPYERAHLGLNTSDVGIFKSTILPSFALHSSFSVAAYALSRATDRGEIKDYFWPLSQVANAWWSAVGEPMYHNNITFTSAMNAIPWTEKVLLTCVTAWGTRLFYRIVSRSLARGRDDPRYEELKAKDPGFWNSALFKLYLPEAAFLTLISLPFTLPFRMSWSSVAFDGETSGVLRAVGVGLFSAGFAMEALADTQVELHRKERDDLCRHGVWSIVRHPNYLGDTLVHLSFVVLNAANTFNPLVLLGPIANYVFLRVVGGDAQNEASQEERYRTQDPHKYAQLQAWRREKNSFWPALSELANPWTWAVVASGLVGVVVEEVVRSSLGQ